MKVSLLPYGEMLPAAAIAARWARHTDTARLRFLRFRADGRPSQNADRKHHQR